MAIKSKILFSLYQRLKLSPCSFSQLRLWKEANSFDISDRTLYRYLHELDIVVAEKFGEILEIVNTESKRKYWKISPLKGSSICLKEPEDFTEQQAEVSPVKYNFGQAIVSRESGKIRELIISAIEANAQLNMELGVTEAYEEVFPGDVVLPLKLIRHQCMDHLCFYHERNHKIQTAPLSSLSGVSFDGGKFSPELYQETLKEFFNERFGIAPNIDDSIYQVELVFSETVSRLVMNYHWHPSQRITTLDSGEVRVDIRCGINEELIQWVLKFTDQVTVVKPQLLIDKLLTQCHRTLQRYPVRKGSERLQIAS